MAVTVEASALPVCPDCKSTVGCHVDRIPGTNVFAGRSMGKILDGGDLWNCPSCRLFYRWPTIEKSTLDELYSSGSNYTWVSSFDDRPDWKIAKNWLESLHPAPTRILDVGCFDGAFLSELSSAVDRYGIEVHPAAKIRAEKSGINIIGSDFEDLPSNLNQMDCIFAFDVLEHIRCPADFIAKAISMVEPGGRLIISTGNVSSPSFRLMRGGYWYCTIAEHISFLGPEWCVEIAEKLGLVIERKEFFSHVEASLRQRWVEFFKNFVYRISPRLFSKLRKLGLGKMDVSDHESLALHPPGWMSAKDHFIVQFRRK